MELTFSRNARGAHPFSVRLAGSRLSSFFSTCRFADGRKLPPSPVRVELKHVTMNADNAMKPSR